MSIAGVAALDEILRSVSDRCDGGRRSRSFWVGDARPVGDDDRGEGRPFSLLIGNPGFLDLDPLEVEAKLGFLPQTNLALSAGVNAPEDHRILARLCIRLAERFEGLIDYGGPLPDIAAEVGEGALHGLWYTAVAGNRVENHVLDPTFLRGWLRHPQFEMLK